jgi:hypothetical protein
MAMEDNRSSAPENSLHGGSALIWVSLSVSFGDARALYDNLCQGTIGHLLLRFPIR